MKTEKSLKNGADLAVLARGNGFYYAVRRFVGDAIEARRLVDICLEAGVNLFDTADVYSNGASEEVLGAAIKGRPDAVLISTKTGLPMGEGPNDAGTSRLRLIRAVEDALRRTTVEAYLVDRAGYHERICEIISTSGAQYIAGLSRRRAIGDPHPHIGSGRRPRHSD